MTPPLTGLRILDLSRVLTGPFCSMILADLGADVIKIEMPGEGDETRSWGPPFVKGESSYFLSINRNKKSVTINLKSEKGRRVAHELAKRSDVVLENFRPGVADRLGVNYESLKRINNKLIYCSFSSFGQTGPYSDRPGYDIIIQAMGGFMGITGESDRPPVRIGVAIVDLAAGLYAAIAILAALNARKTTNQGQYIDVSLLDCSVALMTYMAGYYSATGKNPERLGSAHPTIVPYQAFTTKDNKHVIIAVGNDRHWELLCRSLGLTELINDKRFETNAKRVENRQELVPRLEKIFLTKTKQEWLDQLTPAEVPCGPVNLMSDIFSDPHIQVRKMLVEMTHPKLGIIKLTGNPIKFSEPAVEMRSAPSVLGQHTKEVLSTVLGMSEREIEQLKAEGAC